jgi:hypothetical protein
MAGLALLTFALSFVDRTYFVLAVSFAWIAIIELWSWLSTVDVGAIGGLWIAFLLFAVVTADIVGRLQADVRALQQRIDGHSGAPEPDWYRDGNY